jgi:hypothetical protein
MKRTTETPEAPGRRVFSLAPCLGGEAFLLFHFNFFAALGLGGGNDLFLL